MCGDVAPMETAGSPGSAGTQASQPMAATVGRPSQARFDTPGESAPRPCPRHPSPADECAARTLPRTGGTCCPLAPSTGSSRTPSDPVQRRLARRRVPGARHCITRFAPPGPRGCPAQLWARPDPRAGNTPYACGTPAARSRLAIWSRHPAPGSFESSLGLPRLTPPRHGPRLSPPGRTALTPWPWSTPRSAAWPRALTPTFTRPFPAPGRSAAVAPVAPSPTAP